MPTEHLIGAGCILAGFIAFLIAIFVDIKRTIDRTDHR